MENNKNGSFIMFLVMISILAIFSGCIDESTMPTPTPTPSIPTATPTPTITPTLTYITPAPTLTQVPSKPSGNSGGSIYPIIAPIPNQPPIAVAGDDYKAYINKSILFNGSDSYDKDGEIVNAEWNIDNESKQGLIVSHIFDKAGEYNVSLIVKDEKGAYGLDYANVLVFQPTEKKKNWALKLPVNHTKEEKPNYSGTASSKMILEYLWGNKTFSQDELYSYGHEKNEINISDIDAKAMKEILNKYKFQKYNFDIVAKENKTDLIKDIVHWFNYEVPGVERANAPNTVPTFGLYDNWIVVKGVASDKNPNATQNPMQVGNFTVYGLWVNDPGVDGIGSNSYKTADEFSKTFLEQMKLPDSYIGKYIAVLEPPEADEQVSIAQPYIKDVNKRFIEFVNKEKPYNKALIQSSTGKDIQSNKFSYYDLLPQQLLNDTSFMNAFNGSTDKPPIKVNETNGSYYLILFEKYENISVVLKIDGEEGYFREASWMDNPVEYKLLTEIETKKLLENYTDSKNLSSDFRFKPNINILNVPANKTQSPYYPLWKIFDLDNNETYVITSDKQVYGKDTKPPKSVTNLTQVANGTNFVNVSWTNPDDKDYKEAFVYINGSFKQNVSKATNFYNATNLTPSNEYLFSVRTADDNGNVNKTFVNLTARTSTSQVSKWIEKADTPSAGGYGEAVVGTGNYIYAMRSYTTGYSSYFWKYDPLNNNWVELKNWNDLPTLPRPKSGTALAWDNITYIYVMFGGAVADTNRTYFYRYNITGNTWEPLSNTSSPQGAGDAITWSGYDGYIYAIIGSMKLKTTAFARYKYNSWEVLPFNPNWTVTDDGASLAWTGGEYLYALRGEYKETVPNGDFARYHIPTQTWEDMKDIPVSNGVGDGGSLLWVVEYPDYIFALGGGEVYPENPGYNFYSYSISTDGWGQLESIPCPIGYYVGNRLGFANGSIYYWQGSPTTEKWICGGDAFYRFEFPPTNITACPVGCNYTSIQAAINASNPWGYDSGV